jgi:hypothetical protein
VEISVKLKIITPDQGEKGHDDNKSDSDATTVVASKKVWENIWRRSNTATAAFLHIHVIRSAVERRNGPVNRVNKTFVDSEDSLYGVVPMTKLDKLPKSFQQRYLLSDLGFVTEDNDQLERLRMNRSALIPFWKPEVAVRLVPDFTEYPRHYMPAPLQGNVIHLSKSRKTPRRGGFTAAYYKPQLHVDEIGLTSDKYIALNSSVRELPLTISYAPMSLQRFLLMSVMEGNLSFYHNSTRG